MKVIFPHLKKSTFKAKNKTQDENNYDLMNVILVFINYYY